MKLLNKKYEDSAIALKDLVFLWIARVALIISMICTITIVGEKILKHPTSYLIYVVSFITQLWVYTLVHEAIKYVFPTYLKLKDEEELDEKDD